MRKNKTTLYLFCLTLMFSTVFLQINVRAEWVPASDEILPTKDAYVVVCDSIGSSEIDNFGGSDKLYVGLNSWYDSVSAIQFDFSELPDNLLSLEFLSDISQYAETTRTIKINILVGIDWDELSVTGISNPFNATNIWAEDHANLTTIVITGTTENFTVDLSAYKDSNELITLLFSGNPIGEDKFSMNSKEATLYSWNNPPRLSYVVDTTPVAGFSYLPSIPIMGDEIHFTDITTLGNAPLLYQWDFGDGSSNSTIQHPDHIFEINGSYNVVLTVTDSNGDISVYEETIVVIEEVAIPGYNYFILILASFGVVYMIYSRIPKNKNH